MIDQKKYNRFIEDILPKTLSIQLYNIITIEGEPTRSKRLIGYPVVYKKIVITNALEYSRSFELFFEWEDNKNSIICYCSLNKAPKDVIGELCFKIEKKVNDSYSDDDLIEIESNNKNTLFNPKC